MSTGTARLNIEEVRRVAKRIMGMTEAALSATDDPCADERALVELAAGVRDAAANALAVAEAALTLAEMALMECEANNP